MPRSVKLLYGVRGILVSRSGGPEVLELVELQDPVPEVGELLVAVGRAGVNYRDIYDREGRARPPVVIGAEGVGKVVAVGEGVTGFSVGDRAAWATTTGSYAELIAVRADRAVPVPHELSDELVAASLVQGLTAHDLATYAYPIREGETVLIHAGAGGVGLLLTQFAIARGASVISTVSTPEKAEACRAVGAVPIGYESFADHVRELTHGQGVAAVYDGVGVSTFDGSIAALRKRGVVVSYGWASGEPPPLDLSKLTMRALSVTRASMTVYTNTPSELRARAATVFSAIAAGRLLIRIDRLYPLANAADAHRRLAGRESIGKLVLEIA